MQDLGSLFRSKREQMHLSPEAMAEKTCIPLRHLLAIEGNRFECLPHAVSARGFVRLYASYLGLDGPMILKRFSEAYTPPAPFSLLPPALPSRRGQAQYAANYVSVPARKRTSPTRTIVIVVLMSGALLLVSLPLGNYLRTQTNAPVSHPPTPPAAEQKEPDSVEAVLPKVEAAPSSNAVGTSPSFSDLDTEGMPLLLILEARDQTWVRVIIDGTEIRDVLLRERDVVRWQASSNFLLTVGNAGGVQINLDGKDLPPLGPQGQVARDVRLTRNMPRENL